MSNTKVGVFRFILGAINCLDSISDIGEVDKSAISIKEGQLVMEQTIGRLTSPSGS